MNKNYIWSVLITGWILIMTTVVFILWGMLNVAHAKTETYNQKLRCLAEAVWRESRGEGYWGQVAVAQVVVNRSRSPQFPNDICKVIFQPGQFPWAKNWKGVWKADKQSYYIARKVLHNRHQLQPFDALFFHATYVNPNWNRKRLAQIGNHIFYL